jgi:hypothetical protein
MFLISHWKCLPILQYIQGLPALQDYFISNNDEFFKTRWWFQCLLQGSQTLDTEITALFVWLTAYFIDAGTLKQPKSNKSLFDSSQLSATTLSKENDQLKRLSKPTKSVSSSAKVDTSEQQTITIATCKTFMPLSELTAFAEVHLSSMTETVWCRKIAAFILKIMDYERTFASSDILDHWESLANNRKNLADKMAHTMYRSALEGKRSWSNVIIPIVSLIVSIGKKMADDIWLDVTDIISHSNSGLPQ